jgi:hypothetical protein
MSVSGAVRRRRRGVIVPACRRVAVSEGKLFGSKRTRPLSLGMLLEKLGVDAVVQLGELALWKEAIAAEGAES